jgi:hypothetical protein
VRLHLVDLVGVQQVNRVEVQRATPRRSLAVVHQGIRHRSQVVVPPAALRGSRAASLLPPLPRCLQDGLHRSLQACLPARLLANHLLGPRLRLLADPRLCHPANLLNRQLRTRASA